MKKKRMLTFLLTALMALTLVPALTTAADEVDIEPTIPITISIDRIGALGDSFVGVAATLTLQESQVSPNVFIGGDAFILTLKDGVKWLTKESAYVDENDAPIKATVSNTGGSEGLIIKIISETTMRVTLPADTGGFAITNNNLTDTVTIPLSVSFSGNTGNIYMTVSTVDRTNILPDGSSIAPVEVRDIYCENLTFSLDKEFKGIASSLTISEGRIVSFENSYSFEIALHHGIKWLRRGDQYVDAYGRPLKGSIRYYELIYDDSTPKKIKEIITSTSDLNIRIISDSIMLVELPDDVDDPPITDDRCKDVLSIPIAVDMSGVIPNDNMLILSIGDATYIDGDFIKDGDRGLLKKEIFFREYTQDGSNVKHIFVAADCTQSYPCTLCPAVIRPATAHSWGVWVNHSPTSGQRTRACGYPGCEVSQTEVMPDHGGDSFYSPSNLRYSFIGGSEYEKGSGKPLIFTVQKAFNLFRDVRANNNTITQGTHYGAKSGSTEITLFVSYLDTLAAGRHTLEVRFTDGTSATTSFTVKDAPKPITPELPVNPFTDVKGADWFIDDVIYVYANGLMTGTSTNPMLFSPNATLTRAMIVTILYRHAGSPNVSGLANPFNDVAEGQWYTNAIKWAVSKGIVSGYGNGKFGTEDNITRQDLAVILMRYMNYLKIVMPVNMQWIIFADEADIADYAMDAIQTFNKLGIINGTGKNASGQTIIDPKGNATRAQAAAMIHRFLEVIK